MQLRLRTIQCRDIQRVLKKLLKLRTHLTQRAIHARLDGSQSRSIKLCRVIHA